MMDHLYQNTVLKNPKSILIILLITLISFGYYSKDFRLDASSETLLLDGDPDLKYLNEINDEQWILTCEGLYKYVNNQLHKFKLWLSDDDFASNNLNIKPSNLQWIKTDTVYKIPTKHVILNVKQHSYKLHPKSNTSFIIELTDDKIQDYYFESKEDLENHSLKEDINSFLSLLN